MLQKFKDLPFEIGLNRY